MWRPTTSGWWLRIPGQLRAITEVHSMMISATLMSPKPSPLLPTSVLPPYYYYSFPSTLNPDFTTEPDVDPMTTVLGLESYRNGEELVNFHAHGSADEIWSG
ncbi:hypothetical protein V6N13_067801 [Hibiscus sabdariffa]